MENTYYENHCNLKLKRSLLATKVSDVNPDYVAFFDYIHNEIKKEGTTVSKLAQAVGTSRNFIYSICAGDRLPSVALARKIGEALHGNGVNVVAQLFIEKAAQSGISIDSLNINGMREI